jgi:Flp pilus assembly protein TadG
MAILLPLLLLLFGIAFTGWDAMHRSIGLTSAARAGAIKAANDLGVSKTTQQVAWDDAKDAVNQEEGTNVYQDSTPGADNYVLMSPTPDVIDGSLTINVVTITISHEVPTDIPTVTDIHLKVHASARY